MNPTIDLQGMKDVEQGLFSLNSITAKSVVRRASREALEPMARKARSLVHVDKGDLRESIDVSEKLAASQRSDKKSDFEMHMGPGQNPQAITEEFGTIDVAANPSIRPAWDQGKMQALDDVGAFLSVETDKATARARRRAARG